MGTDMTAADRAMDEVPRRIERYVVSTTRYSTNPTPVLILAEVDASVPVYAPSLKVGFGWVLTLTHVHSTRVSLLFHPYTEKSSASTHDRRPMCTLDGSCPTLLGFKCLCNSLHPL